MANIKLLDLLQEALNIAKIRFLDTGKIKKSTFDEFDAIDSTQNKAYIEKMCEFYVKYEISKEDIIDMFTRVIDSKEENPTKHKELKSDIFNKIKSKKDFDNFKDKVLDFKFKIPNIQQYKNSENAELVYEDNRFVIFRVLNFEGACEIGIGTKWCHSDKNKNSYDNYKYKTNYMFFDNSYPKNNPKSGFALSVDSDGKIIELKSKNQKYNGKKHLDYPISYLTDDLGLDLKIFKYIKRSDLSINATLKDGLTEEIIASNFSWLLDEDVNIKNAEIGYDKSTKKLIWYDGIWWKGTWEDGIWNSGTFYEGIWKNGTFNFGTFRGTWEKGTCVYGEFYANWYNGTFKDGAFHSGEWYDGTFESGDFYGKWHKGTWEVGQFRGEWLDPNNPKPLNVKEYRDGLTFDIIKDKFPWLLEDIAISHAIIGQRNDKLVWYSGMWFRGTWEDGIWKKGEFGSPFTPNKSIWKGGKWLAPHKDFMGVWDDPNNISPTEEHEEKVKNIMSSNNKVEDKVELLYDLGYITVEDISKLIKKYGSI